MWIVDTCTLTYFFQILNLKYTRKIKFINLSINIYAQYVKLDTIEDFINVPFVIHKCLTKSIKNFQRDSGFIF